MLSVPPVPSTALIIACPACQGEWLHQRGVTIWHRKEDAEFVKRIDILDGEVNAKMDLNAGNPSSRRQGMTILFECEHCHSTNRHPSDVPPLFGLDISQHKGQTFVVWHQLMKAAK